MLVYQRVCGNAFPKPEKHVQRDNDDQPLEFGEVSEKLRGIVEKM